MPMMASQILISVDFTKKPKNRDISRPKHFLNSLITHQGLVYGKKQFSSGDFL